MEDKYWISGENFYVKTSDRKFVLGLVKSIGIPTQITVSNSKIEIKGFKNDLVEFLEKATFF